MDVEAEILDLQLRVGILEASIRPEGTASGDFRGRGQHGNLPADRCAHREAIQSDLLTTSISVAEARAEVADVRMEMSQDFAALGLEISGLRRQTNENFASARHEMMQKLDSLRCEMIELGLRLDRLLENDSA
ncbi:hypothetical protein [Nonomuraea zeae]|uniref:Uncharacterized protein n=1 Tax=Nonomuraea zeae TaxID=1642303 RepID=A0A5S4HDS5_9ACTN|nr:hypothetical protein [Nonomuraea zeae]TMR37050.1 hypothetical protein ETD85_08925 [Nonomuraea zeae]